MMNLIKGLAVAGIAAGGLYVLSTQGRTGHPALRRCKVGNTPTAAFTTKTCRKTPWALSVPHWSTVTASNWTFT